MAIYNSALETVGKTPLIELCKLKEEFSLNANIYAKVEFFNPSGSVKDRAALNMLNTAFEQGIIDKTSIVIEPTSGNTGIGLAMACAYHSIRSIFTMPSSMSKERISLFLAYGAEVVLTEPAEGMNGAIKKANELACKYENSFIPSQFENMANAAAHKQSTGPEIYADLGDDIQVFVATIGTGGTLSGCSEFLKGKIPSIITVGVEPAESPLITEGRAAAHKIQGIGANFIPKNYNPNVVDRILTADFESAKKYANFLAKKEGLLCGISSGAAITAAIELAKSIEFFSKNIVVILPDSGSRYLSTGLFDYE